MDEEFKDMCQSDKVEPPCYFDLLESKYVSLGKLNNGEKGKPIERWGRKATGLRAAEAAYDGWAAAERIDL